MRHASMELVVWALQSVGPGRLPAPARRPLGTSTHRAGARPSAWVWGSAPGVEFGLDLWKGCFCALHLSLLLEP